MSKKVCISGYYGFDNFGDETILKILCENLKSFSNPPEITVFSSNPEKTSKLYEVGTVRTFDIKSVVKTIKESDCLISGGGSLLQDVTSKKSLLYYLFVIGAALFFKKNVIIFAQGIGPVNNGFLRFLTVNMLKKAKYITVRDEKSLEFLKKNGVEASLCSDPVWNVTLPETREEKDIIGVQLREFPSLTPSFLDKLAEFTVKNYSNRKIRIFSLQNKIDMKVSELFKEKVKKLVPDSDIEVIENTSNEEVIKNLTNCKELTAMRYHACLVAIKAGIKLLPLSYDIKVETLAKDFGLPFINLNDENGGTSAFDDFVNKECLYDKNKIECLKFDFGELEKSL